MTSKTAIRWVGWVEALSFLLLLGIAMPLKYHWGEPLAVKILGRAHGFLFVVFAAQVLTAMAMNEISRKVAVYCLIGSVLPFGPLLYDKALMAEDQGETSENAAGESDN